MIFENVDASQVLYAIGAVVLAIGVIAGVAGLLIRRRLEEEHRDERYVRERRGEEVAQPEPPRIAWALQYAGVAIVAIGIVVLVAGWTVAPGQS
jgi:ABC-type Fe3+ transport system permease subunit